MHLVRKSFQQVRSLGEVSVGGDHQVDAAVNRRHVHMRVEDVREAEVGVDAETGDPAFAEYLYELVSNERRDPRTHTVTVSSPPKRSQSVPKKPLASRMFPKVFPSGWKTAPGVISGGRST